MTFESKNNSEKEKELKNGGCQSKASNSSDLNASDNNSNGNTVQSSTSAAASFIETLGRKTSLSAMSPRTDENETSFVTPSGVESNSRMQRTNSIVTGTSPFVSTSSLWTTTSTSTSLESLNDCGGNGNNPLGIANTGNVDSGNNNININSASGSLWDTPRRSSMSGLANWKCVGSAASMLQDGPSGRIQTLLNGSNITDESSTGITANNNVIRPRSSSQTITANSNSFSRPTSPLELSRAHFMQLTALLHEEIGIESPEEAVEIFKRSSMDSLLDFDPGSLFSKGTSVGEMRTSTTNTANNNVNVIYGGSNNDFRRHSINWLSTDSTSLTYEQHISTFKAIPETSASASASASASVSTSHISSRTVSPLPSDSSGSRGSASFDTFPEEFIFNSATTAAALAPSSQFSKKRFARRHSIAADGVVAALEESFSQNLNFGNLAEAAEFIPSNLNQHHHLGQMHHYNSLHHVGHAGHHNQSNAAAAAAAYYEDFQSVPITGNIYAAYAGLLGEDFVPEGVIENSSSNTNANINSSTSASTGTNTTFLSTMMKNSNPTGSLSGAVYQSYHLQMPISLTPAQAGINPTVLSFPNASFHLTTHKGPLYLIEFKSGRTEVFFIVDQDAALKVKIGDLVIVEADRGEDFGRITGEISITKIRQLISQLPHEMSHSNHSHSSHPHSHSHTHPHPHNHNHNDDGFHGGNGGNVNHNLAGLSESEIAALLASKEIVPKRIHRHATTLDMKFLQAKAHEEAYAMSRCQSRIRQKKLPMEVVDAEYQWDRNKLTFYFSADRRIDFRELVRDLFRIYKTRIWMCAVDKNRANLLNSLAAASAVNTST